MHNYLLTDEAEIVAKPDLHTWAKIFEGKRRLIARTYSSDKKVNISTIFLALDHAYGNGPPMLFETMIFGGKENESEWRYSTLKEALMGHIKACILIGVDPWT